MVNTIKGAESVKIKALLKLKYAFLTTVSARQYIYLRLHLQT